MSESNPLKYEFFTPYYRGPDLVFNFVMQQPDQRYESGLWRIQAAYGYEHARVTKVFAEDRLVGDIHSINDRFAAIADLHHAFIHEVETAATEWAAKELAAEEAKLEQGYREDAALCARMLAASAEAPPPND